MTEPDLALDRPEESSEADVTLVARGITVTAYVEESRTAARVVRPAGEGAPWKQAGRPGAGEGAAGKQADQAGDAVELYWVGGDEVRTLPARISDVESGIDPRAVHEV